MPRHKFFKWDTWALDTAERFWQDEPEVLAVDTETTGVTFFDTAFCATVAWVNSSGVQSGYFSLSNAVALLELQDILSRSTLVFHNAKFDLQKLIRAGVLERDSLDGRIHDTECMAQLLDEHRPKGLKDLGKSILGYEDNETQALAKARRKLKLTKDAGYHLLPRRVLVPYAVNDAVLTIGIYEELWPQVCADEQLSQLYGSEMELVLAMLDVEANSLGVDLEYLDRTTREVNDSILKTELKIGKLIGKKVWYPEKPGQKTPEGRFNPNSHEQIQRLLLDRGVTVPNTRSDTLKELDDPFGSSVLELRTNKKIKDFLVAIGREQRNGRIHPWFNLFKPITGRMSSSKGVN